MHRCGLLTILLHQSVARHSHSIVVLLQPAGVAVRRRACEIRGGLQLLRGRSRIRIHTYGGGGVGTLVGLLACWTLSGRIIATCAARSVEARKEPGTFCR